MHTRVFRSLLLAFLALAAAFAAQPASAQPRPYGREGERAGVQPLDRLLPGIRRQYPGQFYDAEGPTYGPSGDPHYHLKWMTPDGRVIWFDADARSGRVLRQSPGRDRFDEQRQGPQLDRYPPYMAEPYDGGYGRRRERDRYERGFAPPPRYGNPYDRRGEGGGERRRWRRD